MMIIKISGECRRSINYSHLQHKQEETCRTCTARERKTTFTRQGLILTFGGADEDSCWLTGIPVSLLTITHFSWKQEEERKQVE
jgi:hypothetical protein